MGKRECDPDPLPHRAGQGSVTPVGRQPPVPPTQLTPAPPVPCLPTAAAVASLLPNALSGILFRTVWWEVRAGYLELGPCT